jgi:glycerol-3-phosphate dehydrogenase
MKRRFRQLAQGPFDLLVIGGGIYGAWTAYDAALRGLSVALVEKNDWASGTSQASSKLIHGGLRYLEQRHFDLVRKSLDERRRLAWLGPHRVQPLRFVMPVYAGDRVGRTRLKLGLWLYDRFARRGLEAVGRSGPLEAQEMVRRFGVDRHGLRGGFEFGDCVTDDARFTLEIVAGALDAGAVAVNHAAASELVTEEGRVVGAVVQDQENGTSCRVRAGMTVNCAGPWAGRLVEPHLPGFSQTVRLTKGVHLVMPSMTRDEAFLLQSNRDRRIVFLIPWYGRTLLGTTDTDFDGNPDAARVEEADIHYLLDRARRAFPKGPWERSEVITGFCGLRTLPGASTKAPSFVSREWRLDEPMPGLLTPLGGKFTSARADAIAAVNLVLRRLDRDPIPSTTAERLFPWAPDEDYTRWSRRTLAAGMSLGLDEETAATCLRRHGKNIDLVFHQIRHAPELAFRVVDDAPFCRAEIAHAVSGEMALTLEDVLRRRVPVLLASRMPETALREVTAFVAHELHWSARRREQELEVLTARFKPALTAHGSI